MLLRANASMVRQLMIAGQTINRFRVLPRWLNALGDAAHPKAHPDAFASLPSLAGSGKYRFALGASTPRLIFSSNGGFKNQPSAALQFP